MKKFAYAVATAALVSFGAQSAQSAPITIGFDALSVDGSPYAGHSEDGFTVTPTAGDWFVGLQFGNPTPSIFAGPAFSVQGTNTVEVTGGTFNFLSSDFACNNGSDCSASITGFLGASVLFTQVSSVTAGPPFQFFTTNNGAPGVTIDKLVITLTPGNGTSSINLDNIVLDRPVPEPALMSLLALGFGGALRLRRRRAQQ